jgi:hypothetical protein
VTHPFAVHVDRLAVASRQQQVLAVAVLTSVVGFTALALVAGAAPRVLVLLVVGVLGLLAAMAPDSSAALFAVVWLAGWWLVSVPATLSVEVPLAALCLLVLHVAAALGSYGPGGLTVEESLVRLWVVRSAGMALALLATWLVARWAPDVPQTVAFWLAGAAIAAAAALLGARLRATE